MIPAIVLAMALSSRPVLVVNAGDDAIFALRVGHVATAQWGEDILGFAEVVDVSRGQVVRLFFDPATCTYDVQATYRSGVVIVKRNVNLCTVERIDFRN